MELAKQMLESEKYKGVLSLINEVAGVNANNSVKCNIKKNGVTS
ncbi:hypothetical protein [Priestia megaterium]